MYDVESVLLYEDIASAPKGQEEKRRGMADMFFAFKISGALAEEGKSRDEIIRKTRLINDVPRTLAIALKPCIFPTSGQPMFTLADDETKRLWDAPADTPYFKQHGE